MKVLITGGCGFLGTNLAESIFSDNKFQLFVLDNLSRQGSKTNLAWLKKKGKFNFLNEDVRSSASIETIIKKIMPDVIFHFAGQVTMTKSIENPKNDFEINVLGSLNILEAVRKHCPKSIVIYSSTNKVYGDLDWVKYNETDTRYVMPDFPVGFPETIPLSFHSPYGCSKGAADQYMLDYYRIFGIKTVVFRHSSMFGGRQFSTYDQGWIGWFCQKALEARKGKQKQMFSISGNGKQVRDVLYADDMVSLYLLAIDNIDKIKGEVFNIGGGMANSLSILELFTVLEKEIGVNLEYQKTAWRQSDQKIFVADISKYSKATLWKPKIDKIIGIKKMIEWVASNDKD